MIVSVELDNEADQLIQPTVFIFLIYYNSQISLSLILFTCLSSPWLKSFSWKKNPIFKCNNIVEFNFQHTQVSGTIKIQKPFFLSVLQSRVNHNNLFANCFSNREYQSAEQRHTILMLPVDETLIYSVMIISLNKTEPMWCLCMQVQKTLNFSKKKINQIYHFLIVIY